MSVPGELRQEGLFVVKNLLLIFLGGLEKYPCQVKKKKKKDYTYCKIWVW